MRYHEAGLARAAIAEETDLEGDQVGVGSLEVGSGGPVRIIGRVEVRRGEARLEAVVAGAAGEGAGEEVVPDRAEKATEEGEAEEARPSAVQAEEGPDAETGHGAATSTADDGTWRRRRWTRCWNGPLRREVVVTCSVRFGASARFSYLARERLRNIVVVQNGHFGCAANSWTSSARFWAGQRQPSVHSTNKQFFILQKQK